MLVRHSLLQVLSSNKAFGLNRSDKGSLSREPFLCYTGKKCRRRAKLMELENGVQYIKGVGPKKAGLLACLGIKTVYDLLTYYPRAYEDRTQLKSISALELGEVETTSGIIQQVKELRTRKGMSILTAYVSDGSGYMTVTWFNQKFLKPKLVTGARLFITGKVEAAYGGVRQCEIRQIHSFEILNDGEDMAEDFTGIFPVYPSTEKLNQKFFRKLIHSLLYELKLEEVIPDKIRQEYSLLDRNTAFRQIHFPKDSDELEAAHRTLVFEELYLIQCGLILMKKNSRDKHKGIRHLMDGRLLQKVYDSLPFTLTEDQQKTWMEIKADMEKSVPMRRLVQGDVGSGKTVIAMLALVKTVENGYQGALMAPTEILARQHFENFTKQLEGTGIRIGLLSGKLTKKQHEDMHVAIAGHEIDIIIGTHALIQENVSFKKLGLVVTDEQHRFGISQRTAIEKKGDIAENSYPDVLVMTATPIPRTMTLTVYGDLDVSSITKLPPGRKPVRTFVRTPERRELVYNFVKNEIKNGRQAYVVCPLIEKNEELDILSAEEAFEELANGTFKGISCGLVHGKLTSKEKESVMEDFYSGKIKLLVATTVIEVGVNVPNASIMVIENAERFGLAQLHQLRGRIGRGGYKSYCVLISNGKSSVAKERLGIMETINDGFKLAEEDLKLRGPGQFFGARQHGLPDLKLANVLGDIDVLLEARRAAIATLSEQETLSYVMHSLQLQYKNHFLKIMEN